MKHTRSALRMATLLAMGSAGLSAHATDGYFPHGFGLKAKGMGGAATAMAQDGFAGANNPAASAFAGNRLEVGADVFMPDREMSRTGTGGMLDVKVRSDKRAFPGAGVGLQPHRTRQPVVCVTAHGNGVNTTYPGGQLNCGQGPANALRWAGAPWGGPDAAGGGPIHGLQVQWSATAWGLASLLVFQMFKASGLEGFSPMSVDASRLSGSGYDTSQGVGVRRLHGAVV
ncbi:MAG: hypothetical protein R3E42_18395 [Burkholderiaceae bacterium]